MLVCGLIVLSSQLGFAAPVQWAQNGHWYEVVVSPEWFYWNDANAAAVAKGGYLATITSNEENNFVFDLTVNTPGAWGFSAEWAIGPWLGGYQDRNAPDYSEPSGGWRWVTGEPWGGYTNWLQQPYPQPDNWLDKEDYLLYWGYWQITPTWNDALGFLHSYVIEYDSLQPVASFKSLNVIELGDPDEETFDGGHMVGGVIRFDASKSYDPGGGKISYQWVFNGGERLPSPDQKPDVVFKEARIYTITLVVVDDTGLESEPYTEILDLSLKDGDLIFIRTAWWDIPFNIVLNTYTHVGMYRGGAWMIESILFANPRSDELSGVVLTPLSGWSYPSETYATLVRVETADDKIREEAVAFARSKLTQEYDLNVWQKNADKPNYYCSELIWAAYYKASKGKIELGKKKKDKGGVWPDDIISDTVNTKAIGYHHEHCPW